MKPSSKENLFPHFVDDWDMTMCCSADLTGEEINRTSSKYGLYFPLVQDANHTLREHIRAMEYTSRSARFGPYIDNVLGMNWELPSGKRIKVGERVVKSTTGYDLLRFLLGANGLYGQAIDYVIRLRPMTGAPNGWVFCGETEVLKKVQHELRGSSWSHWIDVMDLIVSIDSQPKIELIVNCKESEKKYFDNYFDQIAKNTGASLFDSPVHEESRLPWLTIKAMPSQTLSIAEKLVKKSGGKCRILLMNGVVLLYPSKEIIDTDTISEIKSMIQPKGGHIQGIGYIPDEKEIRANEKQWTSKLGMLWSSI